MLIAYLLISVVTGVVFAGVTLASGHGLLMAFMVYWLGGTVAFFLTMWLAAAVFPRRWEPFADHEFEEAPSQSTGRDQDKATA